MFVCKDISHRLVVFLQDPDVLQVDTVAQAGERRMPPGEAKIMPADRLE
jgi:hypothetical protein